MMFLLKEKRMELREYFYIIKKRALLIVLIILAATLASGIISYFVIKPVYKADISVIIGKTEKDNSTINPNYSDVMMYQTMVKTYSEFAKSRTVAEDVIKKLNLEPMKASQLLSMITVAPKGTTEFLTITVKSKDPEQAMKIANQLAKSLKEISANVKKSDNVMLLDEALLPIGQDTPRPMLNMAIAFFLGIMISVGLVFVIEFLDNTIKTQEDVEKLLGIPVIGLIPLVMDKE
jgi:capsular polysaccharide biosynthesis protein